MSNEIERRFVGLPSPVIGRAGAGGHPCQGLYHTPAGSRPVTAFIATHFNVDFSEHYLADRRYPRPLRTPRGRQRPPARRG